MSVLLVLQDDLGVELAPVGERDADLGRTAHLDDVVVGHDDAVGADDHAGAQRVLDALLRHAERFAEEAAEQRIVGKRRHERLHARPHVDVDHGRRRLLDDRRERVLRRLARGRHLPALCCRRSRRRCHEHAHHQRTQYAYSPIASPERQSLTIPSLPLHAGTICHAGAGLKVPARCVLVLRCACSRHGLGWCTPDTARRSHLSPH